MLQALPLTIGPLLTTEYQFLALAIDEPDVSITDYLLVLETAYFALLIVRQHTDWHRLRMWSTAFFASAALAALAGGTDHGFMRRDGREFGHDLFWTMSLLAIGLTALTMIAIGSEVTLPRSTIRPIITVGALIALAYALIVLFFWRDFLIAIAIYAPAALFLLASLIVRFRRHQERAALLGIAAVLMAFVAAAVQRLEIAIDPIDLSHNAFYHLIQAVSFALFFGATRGMLAGLIRRPLLPARAR